MSEKAIECVSQMVHGKPFAELNELEANVALRDAPYVDAAVAPLVALHNERKQWSESHWQDEPELNRDWWRRFDAALEGWKK